jgi:radical SAM protein with 4Fe4S-binding SPASM domain
MLREENKQTSQSEWLNRRTVVASRPRFVMVELTRRCNLSCLMCRPHLRPFAAYDMSEELFEKITTEYFPFAEIVDLHGYGESLVLPGIIEKLNRVSSAGATLRIVTNLSFMRPEVILWLAKNKAYVSASVDSGDPRVLASLRRGADPVQIQRNLRVLGTGNPDRTNIYCTVQRPALPNLESIVDFAADAKVREVRFHPVAGSSNSVLSLSGRDDEVDAALNRCVARARARKVRLIIGKLPLGSRRSSPFVRHCCLHPWSFFCIAADGGVTFCDGTMGPAYKDCLMGNVATQSFGDIWNGPAWSRLRLWHAEQREVDTEDSRRCLRCYKHRMNDFDHILEPESAGRNLVLWDPRS